MELFDENIQGCIRNWIDLFDEAEARTYWASLRVTETEEEQIQNKPKKKTIFRLSGELEQRIHGQTHQRTKLDEEQQARNKSQIEEIKLKLKGYGRIVTDVRRTQIQKQLSVARKHFLHYCDCYCDMVSFQYYITHMREGNIIYTFAPVN